MSAPVMMESSRSMIDMPTTEPSAGLNFLAIVRRRWPWVLVGMFIGVVGGILAYAARPSIYQSNAQVLVVKKNDRTLGSGAETRTSMMEDYMSTQLTILKSEKVLTNAARNIPNDLRGGFPTETAERAKLLSALLGVSREKDPSNPGSVNNILNVSMKGSNPDDAQKLLEIVINAYRAELKGFYDEATEEKLQLLNNAVALNSKRLKENVDARTEAMAQIRKVTQEHPETLRLRMSKNIEISQSVKREINEVRGMLAQIEKCANNAADRAILFTRLQSASRNPVQGFQNRSDPTDPKYMWEELEAQAEQLSKRYGPDHEIMIALRARIEFLKKKYAENNPSDPEGKNDQLKIFQMYLEQKLGNYETIYNDYMAEVNGDAQKLQVVMPLASQIEAMAEYISARTKLIDTYEGDITQTELTRATGGFQAQALNQPSRDLTPVAPKLSQSALLGLAAGLLFGVGLAALAELSDKGFRSPADIRSRLGLAVIGHIPPIRTNLPIEENLDLEPTVVSALRPKSVEAEAYRGVRTALYFNAAGSTHQMIQVTSPSQGDGKSTLAANLAVSIAQSGKRTLLVDCDMRRPRVHRVFHLPEAGPGLSAVIGGTVPLSAAIQRTVIENLSLLPCGKKPQNPAELLTSPNFSDLLDRLKADYDYVILDTPPVLAVSDPSAVAPRADGVILVFRMTSKVRPLAERAREQLTQIGANIIGVVVNGAGRSNDGSYGGYAEYSGYASAGQYMDNYTDSDDDEAEAPPKKG